MPVKMWQGWSSVQTRLTLVMLAAATVAALVLVVSGKSETRKMDAYLAADAKEDGELLDRTLELEGGSLATFAKDYTNWGEMVRFVETGDRTWASVNIDDVLTTYRADAAWVFDAAGSPVYAVRDSTLEALLKPLPPGLSVKDEFGDGHFCHFFIAGPDGPVEIRGATIHPSEDDERKTPVRGYFLAARSWNRQYLTELTRLTGKTIRVEPTHGRTKPSTEIARQLGEIKFIRPLPGPEGKPELMLTALLRPEWIAVARRSSRDLSVQMAALALLGVLGLTMALWLWVTRPLGQIRRSLESGTSEALKPLERSRTEFGQLAQLVDQSFGQNAAQVKEVTERKQAEQTLHESEERFRELFESMSSGVAVYETRDRGASFIFTNLNRGAERIDSLRREEVVGRYVQQVFPGIEEFGLLAVLRRVWQTGKPEQHPVGHYEDDRISGWRENYVYKLPSGEVVAVYDDVTARIEAEVALRKNEARLQEAQTLGRTGNWEFDLDSQKLEWSDETYRLYERDKPLGPPTLEEEASYYSPEEVLRLRGFARQATEEGRDISYDLTANLPSGRTVFFSARMHPVKDETGRVVKLFGTIHDITERKQAEAGLRESAEKYRLVVDNADEAILVAQDGKLVFTNPRTNQMTGYTREELLGRSFVEFIHPDDRALVADRYRRRIAGEDIPVGYDFRIVRRDGETRHVEINATRIDWMGRPATLNFLADITERKQAEEALRESEARMRTITGSAKDAIIMMDDSGLVTFWNPAAEAMFGYAAEDVIGRKLHEFLTPERFRAAHAAAFGQFRATGEGGAVGKTVELAATRKDGTEVPAELSLSAIKIGDKWHGVGIVRDISERKRGEAVLRETNAYLDNLIAHANAPIIVWDPDFRITRFNRAFERLTGRRESDVKGQTLDILFPASRREDSLSLIHRTATGERWETVEIAIQHVNGSVFTVLWNSATLYTPTGSVLATIAQGQDITERKRAEAEAKRHAELQAAINEMLRVSLEDLPLDSILEKSLGIITAIPWLVLDLRGSIHLVEDDPEVLVVKAQRGLANSLLVMCDRVPFGRCLCGRAASTRQLVFADHVDDSHENQYDGIHDHGHYCVPMLSADQRVLGVLNLYFAAGGRRNKETEELLGVVANVLAGVVQRKRAEEDVKLKAELLDAGTDSIFLHDPAGRFLYANESSYRTRGYTKEEFLALNLHDLDVPEYAARIEPRIAEMLRTGAATFESAQFRRDRSVIPVEVHARMLKVGGRELILSVVRDITERKRTETELRESELKFRAIFDNASEGMFLVDQDSRKFVLANGSCLRMLGYSAEEFANLSIADIHPEEDLHFVFEQIGVFMKGETGKRGDVRFKRKDGSLFPADTSPGAIMLGDKKCILIVFSDITERKHAEAELVKYRDHLEELVHARTGELEQSNKELETFSYSVSHDLRAPLRAINGFAQALQEDCSAQLDPVGLDYLDRVRAASRSMAELIDNLLTLARSSRLPLERKPVNLSELARTIAGELHSAEPARKVELVIPDSMTAQADPVLAEMVLRNLLSNAWKFTGKHPTARIEVGETVRDGEPVWFVRDDGAGFDMAYVGNLSKPFQRLHGPADFPGTGIGLVTVQRLVLRHGGRGWIEGAVEKGATFYFTFQTATREA